LTLNELFQVKNKLIFFLFSLIFSQGIPLFAIGEDIKIEEYSYKDGLTTSMIYNVYKDSKGFLWICSDNGLFRFDGYSFRNINTLIKNFLNHDTYCITEDPDHNFLIGTRKGVYYYNTHTEKLFPLKLSLGNKCIIHKIIVLQDKIWVASDIGLLLIRKQRTFDPDNLIQVQLLLPDPIRKGTQDNIINTIFTLPGQSSLWVGTNGALFELDQKKLVFHYINSLSQNSIREISRYNNSIIVSSWDGGVFLVNPVTHKLENDLFINNVNKIVGNKRVKSAFIDSKNQLWVATFGNGLYIFEQSKFGSLSFVNYRNDQRQQENLKSDFIYQMYLDNTGIVWLCMNQPVLSKVYFQKKNLRTYNFLKQTNSNASKEILAVNQSTDKDKLWVTTNGSGIYLFDVKSQEFMQYTDKTTKGLQLQDNNISICYQDKNGNLWIVYPRIGLYVVPSRFALGLLDGSLKTIIRPIDANTLVTKDSTTNSYITSIYEDSSGRLWFGGWASLYFVELKPNSEPKALNNLLSDSKTTCVYSDLRPNEVSFPISPISSILEINKNKYWIGTYGTGIIQFDELLKSRFSDALTSANKNLPTNNARVIYKDKRNGVWIGTNSGLCYWNLKTDNFKIFTAKNGLCSDNVNSIVEDKNLNIWVSTSYGISEIQSKDFTISNFYSTNKEKFNQYITNAGVLTKNGLVCFSTNESLVFINPDSVETNSYIPPLYFTDIKIDNETVMPLEKYSGTCIIEANINECKTINVPYNHTLSIEFAVLDYYASKPISYKYKIGNNKEWILLQPGQRNLVLPNLSHGEYTLSIMAANLVNNNNIRSIRIDYLPPFWLSKIAYFIYILFILGLLLIYRRLLIQKIIQKSIIEKERFEIKKLEELDKMKSEFFYNISHEFRTPLSLIIDPLAKLIKDEEISNRNKERIDLILKSSERLLKLTNEMMDFSKIEKNLFIPDFQICDIGSFVNEICQLFTNLADSMNFEFKIYCSFEQFEIPIDMRMIEKVIFNLLSNAFKYTPANGMIMVNLTKSKREEEEFVKLSVINTGEGINNENLNKIFDRYYQVNNVQNRNMEGTGIGLSLVKNFVELHNGKVEVKSEPNLETCFDIYLPVHQNKIDIPKESFSAINDLKLRYIVQNQHIKKQISKPTFHYQLLIIEDDDDIRNYIIDELSSDFKILSARNGEEGLKIANETIPDLIITDIIMPVLSGLELCRKLKNQMITSHIPILILSAKATIENQIEGLEMGADVYMIKPFSIDHLKAQILRLISFKQAIYLCYLKETALIPQGALTTKHDEEFMQKVMDFIEANLTNSDLNVDQLAQCVSLSKVQTYRKIKAITGMSIVEFIRTIRLKKSVPLILEGQFNFSEIAFETGFSSPSYFSKCFHDHFGKTPSEFAIEFGENKNAEA
jgi:signal transduction histidine kinase/ligand-binding sensor domain-containing protein/DNA-binding response OmpR family regulator